MKALHLTALGATLVPVACAQAGQASQPREAKNQERPNIVIFVADDLLSTELSCYGGRNLETPNIDRLAREGVQFSHCFASEAMSVPIRASLYTGLFPAHHGSYQNHRGTFKGTKTVNEYMPEEGYRVGRTGKDHPGPKSVYVFDEIPGFTVGCTDRKAPYTCDGIEEWMSREDERPFLLYVCSINTHAPWTWGDPSEFDADKVIIPENCADGPEMREIMTHYLAEVRALDNEVGDVYKTLEKIGKLDNTIFMFFGEQGPQFPGGKWTLWYPGCHSAFIARYPARIKPGSKCDAIVQYEDILPTCIDIAGGKPRPELDGVSFKDAMFGKTKKVRDYAYGIHNNYPEGDPYPIRSIRDKRYALIWNLTPDVQYVEKHLMRVHPSVTGVWEAWEAAASRDERSKFWQQRFMYRPEFEFYDLEKDPWEEHNLIGEKKYARRIAKMKARLLTWMEEQGDKGVEMDPIFSNIEDRLRVQVNNHKKAVLVKDGWIRDPYIVLGPDNYYYLTGTTPLPGDPRESEDFYNTGLGGTSIVGNQLRIWRSRDLVDWQYIGSDYFNTWEQLPTKKKDNFLLWAPEIKWTGTNWVMVHCPGHHSHLAMTEGSDIRGPWKAVEGDEFLQKHDPSLFQDEDGKWYMSYGYKGFNIARLKDDFSGLDGEPVKVDCSDRTIGHEGTLIKKIGKKYVFFGTAWSTDQGRKGSYNLYYCTSDKIFGPYGPRMFVGRFLGHGTPFQDKKGNWWCTAFYNANVPPVDKAGIQTRNLAEDAQTINQMGTTIVPLDVRILPDGDVYNRATDPDYAVPGPDEVQKFKL